MTLMESILKTFQEMSDEDVKSLFLEVLDEYLKNTTDDPCPPILTDEEETILESMGFPMDSEE